MAVRSARPMGETNLLLRRMPFYRGRFWLRPSCQAFIFHRSTVVRSSLFIRSFYRIRLSSISLLARLQCEHIVLSLTAIR